MKVHANNAVHQMEKDDGWQAFLRLLKYQLCFISSEFQLKRDGYDYSCLFSEWQQIYLARNRSLYVFILLITLFGISICDTSNAMQLFVIHPGKKVMLIQLFWACIMVYDCMFIWDCMFIYTVHYGFIFKFSFCIDRQSINRPI